MRQQEAHEKQKSTKSSLGRKSWEARALITQPACGPIATEHKWGVRNGCLPPMIAETASVNAIAMQRGRTTASNAETGPPWLMWGSPKSPIASTASTVILVSEMLAPSMQHFTFLMRPAAVQRACDYREMTRRVLGLVCTFGRPCFS